MNRSEVARTREQIDLQIASAKRALYDPAEVAKHAVITARIERMTQHLQALVNAGLHKEAEEFCRSDDLWR